MKNKKVICRVLFSIAAGVVMLLAVALKAGIYFQTNDDRIISEVLSGAAGSSPDAHVVYVNYLLALPLSLLYRITGTVPWYGLFLFFCQAAAYACFLDCLLEYSKSKWEAAVSVVLTAVYFLFNFSLTGQIQYTSTAAFLAAAGYFCLLLHEGQDQGKKRLIVFAALELIAFLLRDQAMLMIQPFGAAVLAGLALARRDRSWKQSLLTVAKPLALVAAIIVTGWLGTLLGYHGEGWKAYESYNASQTIMFDYDGKPEYEEVQEILDKYGVTHTEYEAYENYVILDWDITPECAQELADYAREHRSLISFSDMAGKYFQYMWQENFWKINRAIVLLWVMFCVFLLAVRAYSLLLPAGALLAAKTIVWGYLFYRGRLPLRITLPLFACELAMLLGLLILVYRRRAEKGWQKILMLCICAVLFYFGFQSGREQYRYVKEQNQGQQIFMKGMYEIEDFCRAHPQNRYLVDAYAMNSYKGSVFETKIYKRRNSVVTGSWYSNSPVMRRWLREYFADCQDGIRLILFADGREKEAPAMIYLEEKTGVEPVEEERFTVSHGGTYVVYYFEF